MIAIAHRRQLAELQAEIDRLRGDLWDLTCERGDLLNELAVLRAVCAEQEAELLKVAS